MGSRTVAPRLRLLGLLLICASIIMGLLLSAAGVSTVNLSSPFAKQIVEKVDEAKNASGLPFKIGGSGSRDPRYVKDSSLDPSLGSSYDLESPSFTPFRPQISTNPFSTTDVDWEQNGAPNPLVSPSGDAEEPFVISLWMLITPICLIGVLLWMTPMPPQSSNRSSRRR